MHKSSGVVVLFSVLLVLSNPHVIFSAPAWAIACGDGRVDEILDNFDQTWTICCTADPSIPPPNLATVAGCNGNAMSVQYDLRNKANDGQSWVVIYHDFASAKNLSNYTHMRIAFGGSNLNSHETVDVKLRNGTNGLFTASLRSMTDLPPWRAIYIDLGEFTQSGRTLDLTNITGMEIGITRCDDCEVFDNPAIGQPGEHTGTLFVDELAVVDLKPGGAFREVETGFETVTPNQTVRSNAANGLLAQVAPSGPGMNLIPAWFPEPNPNFNTYVQAEALLALVYEYERTGNVAFRDAAGRMAQTLIGLQIPPGKAQSGAWYTAYSIEGNTLRPPDRAIPYDSTVRCDGTETMIEDPRDGNRLSAKNIDACEWVGNVGWALIALGKLKRSEIYTDTAGLQAALDNGAAWIIRQPQDRGNADYPNLISLGVEGNISAYFGLMAAGKKDDAATLGNAIFQFGWDSAERRMKPGARPEDAATAMDVGGSWGVMFLRSTGRLTEALDSQSYSASVLRVVSFGGTISGYADIAGPYTPVVEFSGQAVAAGIKDAGFVMQQLYPLQIPNNGTYPGTFPGAPDHWYGGPLNPWITTMPGVSPTAWIYFAPGCDPLIAHVRFTDDPLVPRSTVIRATHIRELRARIDALRACLGLGPFNWTDATLQERSTVISKQHVIDLRDAVSQTYAAAGHAPALPAWTDPVIIPGVTEMKAVHIAEIRAAVVALE